MCRAKTHLYKHAASTGADARFASGSTASVREQLCELAVGAGLAAMPVMPIARAHCGASCFPMRCTRQVNSADAAGCALSSAVAALRACGSSAASSPSVRASLPSPCCQSANSTRSLRRLMCSDALHPAGQQRRRCWLRSFLGRHQHLERSAPRSRARHLGAELLPRTRACLRRHALAIAAHSCPRAHLERLSTTPTSRAATPASGAIGTTIARSPARCGLNAAPVVALSPTATLLSQAESLQVYQVSQSIISE